MTEEHKQTSQASPPAEAESKQRRPWTKDELRQIRDMFRTLGIFLLLLVGTLLVIVAIQEWVF